MTADGWPEGTRAAAARAAGALASGIKPPAQLDLPPIKSLPAQTRKLAPGVFDDEGLAAAPRGHGKRPPNPVKDCDHFDELVSEWIDSRPGNFSSRNCNGPYWLAFEAFRTATNFDPKWRLPDFSLSLRRFGFIAGTITFRGREMWLLVLPSSVDQVLDRLAACE